MKLLVSVRTAEEARAALSGGADIIDIKEPAAGPLGMAPAAALAAIRAVVPHEIPLSLALGEVAEREQHFPNHLPAADFAKIGLAKLGQPGQFPQRWVKLRQQIDAAADTPQRWIAVAYADFHRCHAPPPEAVLKAAMATGCAGLLFDTYDKQAGNLWDHLPPRELRPLVEAAHAQGLLVALAGRLGPDDMAAATELGADIFGVRSAACRHGDRASAVCPEAVARLCAQLTSSR